MKQAKECQNIKEIRNEIDVLDRQILASFRKRLEYVKEIVKFKDDPDGIVARDRQIEVFQKRREWALELGLDPDLIEEIYKTLINWNVKTELEIFECKEKCEV